MPDSLTGPGLPLLIVVEGENDVSFLKAISSMLHKENPDVPDLTHERRVVFLPTGGGNLQEWVVRISRLRKRAFFLFDREKEPETSQRMQVVDSVRLLPGCDSAMTSKRAIENYLHPVAIQEACGMELAFDDETNVSAALALKLLMRTDGHACWGQLPCKRQRRLHEKAKKILNLRAVQLMTPALLAQQDRGGEIVTWLHTIRKLIECTT